MRVRNRKMFFMCVPLRYDLISGMPEPFVNESKLNSS